MCTRNPTVPLSLLPKQLFQTWSSRFCRRNAACTVIYPFIICNFNKDFNNLELFNFSKNTYLLFNEYFSVTYSYCMCLSENYTNPNACNTDDSSVFILPIQRWNECTVLCLLHFWTIQAKHFDICHWGGRGEGQGDVYD
jgi:hypothetical protein